MLIWISVLLTLAALPLGWLLARFACKGEGSIPWFMWYLLFVLPFGAGGFHTFMVPVTVAVLSAALFQKLREGKKIRLVWNHSAGLLMLLAACYCISPLWAADRGMAVFGIVRYLPLLLLAVLLMQYTEQEKTDFLECLPLCGAAVTLVCYGLFQIPDLNSAVSVLGRFSGSFQYPNTYAAFLLACLVVLGTKKQIRWMDLLVGLVLLAGIFLSESRIGLLLLVLVLPGIAVARGKLPPVVLWILAGAGALGAVAWLLLDGEGQLLGRSMASLYSRLLFYKDALPMIREHPFGVGYLGYRALLPTFQTGRYAASYVHCVVLQLLLDIGWLPTLAFAGSIGTTLFSSKTSPGKKLLMGTILLYGLLDFHFQFFVFWVLLLLCLDFDQGKTIRKGAGKGFVSGLCVPVLLLSIWMGTGDLLYRAGKYEAAGNITPFHTEALTEQLKSITDVRELEAMADRILKKSPTVSLAYSAKANAALARGDVVAMIQYKEQAIACAPYTQAEYCDYIDKLYGVLVRYVQMGDQESAAYCLDRIFQVPRMMEAVSQKTDPLAYLAIADTSLELPGSYQELITALREAN